MRINLCLSLFFLVVASQTQTVVGQSGGTFTATGSMSTPRAGHTATLLPDGHVLIAGGAGISAELYDPTTGTFSPTGNTTKARSGHTATLLPSGTVLIAGGDDSSSPGSSAELYDPATGTFTPTGAMIFDRAYHTATLLHDGRVLIAAGNQPCCSPTATVFSGELYDPSTGVFAATGTPQAGAYGLTMAALLADGRVLIGLGSEVAVELYHPATGAFSQTSPRTPWIQGSAALLMNGNVLLAAGNDDPGDSNLAEIFDPSAGAFTPTGNMTPFRADDPATLLPDGTVLIAGSNGDAGVTLASAEFYDPASGTFTRTGDMSVDRGLHTATLLNNGKVLIAGGIHHVGNGWPGLASADLYTPLSVIPAPSLFSLSGDGQGQGAIWHAATGTIVSASNPAVADEALSMYTNNLAQNGVVPPQVILGGKLAQVLYFGAAPGYPGYYQVNFVEPKGVAPGPAIPLRLSYIGRLSNSVTISAH